MSCECGGQVSPGKAKQGSEYGRLLIEFSRCKSCGRVGHETLYVGGEHFASGLDARRLYNAPEEIPAYKPPSLSDPSAEPKIEGDQFMLF